MKSRILILSFLAACYPAYARGAETNLIVETTSRGVAPMVVPRGDGTNLIFEISPRGVPAYSSSNPVRDSDLLGIGPWSEPVSDNHGNTLRGRILVYRGIKTTNGPESRVAWGDAPTYVEIQDMNVTNQHPTRIYFDLLEHLRFVLRDAKGVPADPLFQESLRGGRPPSFWATLPASGRLRLRADAGKASAQGNDGELRLLFFSMTRIIAPGDTNGWSLSASLLAPPPPGNSAPYNSNVWQGTLEIPAVKLSILKANSN